MSACACVIMCQRVNSQHLLTCVPHVSCMSPACVKKAKVKETCSSCSRNESMRSLEEEVPKIGPKAVLQASLDFLGQQSPIDKGTEGTEGTRGREGTDGPKITRGEGRWPRAIERGSWLSTWLCQCLPFEKGSVYGWRGVTPGIEHD